MKSISVIMATLNSAAVLENCLKSIREQEYPQGLIEIVIADGGSTDKTIEIAKKYNSKIIPENTKSPEAAKAIALAQAQNEIVLELDDDNILPNKNWLMKMVSLFEKEPEIVGCYPWRYVWRKNDKILNRYFALLGANDPVAWFLNRADRQSYLSDKYRLAGKFQDKGDYFLVEFNEKNLPTVGANGFLIRRDLLMKAQVDPDHFFHIDVNLDLIRQGYKKYAVVKNDIIHASGESFWRFFQKRKRYMQELYLRDSLKRRYFLYNPQKDKLKIIGFSLYSLSIILPVLDSIRGYLKIRDLAWFLHPLVCFLIFWTYFIAITIYESSFGRLGRRAILPAIEVIKKISRIF